MAFTKSGRQRREEIRERRRLRAEKQAPVDTTQRPPGIVPGAVAADHEALKHCNSYGLPLFYLDKPFVCRDCGSPELWTAKQQKWWYEVAKGDINSIAVRCRACRRQEQERRAEARRVHLEGLAARRVRPD